MTDALNRRELLRRAAAGGAFLTVPGVLAACGGSSSKSAATTSSGDKTLAKTLRFSNWTLYIDTNNKKKTHPSLAEFQKKYGTHVQYTEDINDNASYFGKIQGPLSRGQSIDRDIVVLTDNDRYLSLMIKKGWAEKLDKSAIPNMKNLVDVQLHPGFDPNREYSLPWQSGMTGIAYNDKLTDPVLSIDDLLTNPKLKGKITVLNSMGDALTCVMLANGDDPTKVTDASFNKAFNRIKEGRRLEADPPIHGQRLRTIAGEGRSRGGDVMVRRHCADRQHAHPLERPGRGRCALDGQHADPEGRQHLHRVRVHELRLRPEGRCPDRRR